MLNQKKILLFNVNIMKTDQIKKMCAPLGIKVINIKKEQYNEKLGYLAGIQGIPKSGNTYTGNEFPMEMLVFSGMDSDNVDVFLANYKTASISPIDLKAVVTMHNIFWTPNMLFEELKKEHQSFSLLQR